MALYTSSCGKYRIDVLKPETVAGALKVIRDAYVPDEYISKANELKDDPEAVEQFMGYIADFVLEGTSVVAVEIATGDVVSVCINKFHVSKTDDSDDIISKVKEQKRVPRPSTKSMIKFLIEIGSRINMNDLYRVNCSFELGFLATLSAHRGKNLGYLCCKASVDIAKKLKDGPVATITVEDLGPEFPNSKAPNSTKNLPKMCQMLCSSVATQKIGKALGFTVHLRASMAEFSYKGKTYVERNGFDPYFEIQGFLLD